MIINDEPLLVDQLARDNALCLSVVDIYGKHTDFNGIGSSCYINYNSDFNIEELYTQSLESANHESSYFVDYGGEMIVFGRVINPHLGSYLLLINAKITPEPAGLALIQNQFVFLTIIVLLFATVASLLIARSYSAPFVALTESAKKLAEGDLDVSFEADHNVYNEVDDLANTLNYATDKLKKIDQLRLDLIANVSHDIKTPLTMIMAYSEMISDFSKDDQKLLLEHLEVIRSEANYLDTLVEDILELSMLQSGNLVLNPELINVNELVRSTISHFDKEIDFIENTEVSLKLDEIKINQVLYNLINNAIKHSQAEHITVMIDEVDAYLRVSVIDDGVGIEPENLENIWERYYKIDKNFHRDYKSSGLGLSIAKEIILAHKGRVGVSSTLNKGSKFYFEIKLQADEDE